MKRRYRFRCYPTKKQENILAGTFGCVRYIWNWALKIRTEEWQKGNRVSYAQTSTRMTQLRYELPWLGTVAYVPLQQSLRDLQGAYSRFFNKTAGYPNFKKKSNDQSANYVGNNLSIKRNKLQVTGLGRIKVNWSRDLPSKPSSVRIIKRPSGRYYVSFVCEAEPVYLPRTAKMVGIDFGVTTLAALSTGEKVDNPKCLQHNSKLLKKAQQFASRKKAGSHRREIANRRVARIHEKIADTRKDALHKFSRDIINRFDTIYIEDLNIRGMTKNHSLARSLSDASIGTAIRYLEEKAEAGGKTVIKIDRFFPSSKTCSNCGYIIEKLPLNIRSWRCPECATILDRDVNAAVNILAVGQTVTARGGGVRARRKSGLPPMKRESSQDVRQHLES